VVLFELDDETGEWAFAGRLSPYASVRNEGFGSSLASTGDALWVGSPGFGGRRGTGAIYQFDLDHESGDVLGSHLLKTHELRSRGQFGASLAASDGLAVIGAPGYDNRAGVAFAAQRGENGWMFSKPLENESFGYESMAGELIECEDNLAGDFPCKDVDMTSFVSMKDLGADRGIRTNDLWGWEDPETGREYAIVGLSNQTSFVDVTDPYNPIYLGELDMPATATMSVWRDMKVYKNHAYIVADGAGEHGIQIFDLTQLRNVTEPVTFEETAHYSGIFSAHNIVINEETGFAYSVGSSAGGETCGGGLHMIDLREPAAPVFAGCFTDGSTGRGGTGYSHDAQCVVYHGPDTEHQGKEICVGSNETALSIADVTDKANPVSLSIADYPNVAYAHQGWFSEDQRYFYLNDELDEARNLVDGTRTLIWDLIDLDEPELAGEFIAETTETDHNMYVKGNLLYQSTTSAGLHILDISDPVHPFETAYFDTSPVGGRGVSWSNYPYFKSGAIVVTGGYYGLFILKKKEVDI
jgi:choice-of-anchor B domain-containing protein